MRTSNFALRLQPALMEEARELAKAEGVALNQLINVAVAEKLAATRTLAFFERYTRGADVSEALALLQRPRKGEPPRPGDEVPQAFLERRAKRANVQRALEILTRPRKGELPQPGDEIPEGWKERRPGARLKKSRLTTRSK